MVCIYQLLRLISRSICFKKVVEDLGDVHFSFVTIEGKVVNSNMNDFSSFSGNLFSILFYYLEVGDVGLGMVAGNTL